MIRVLIVEDQGMVLGALCALLDLESEIEVVGKASNGREALGLLASVEADVVVTDVEMPMMNGLELCAAIRSQRPALKTVVLTTFARAGYLKRAMECGASAYLLKDRPAHTLADAIRSVAAGGKVIDPELAAEAWVDPDPLNLREKQVLRLSEAGSSTKEIAQELSLSRGTIRNYLSAAIGKVGASNRIEAAATARKKGWL